MNLNKAMIIGNLTRDPESRNTPSGQTVASFSVATNLIWKDQSGQQQKKVEFHNVVAWRRLAEICNQYLQKGSKVYIEGRLQTNEWTGQDGVKRFRTEIIAENMIMLDNKGNSPQKNKQSENQASSPSENIQEADENSDEEIKVENIPF